MENNKKEENEKILKMPYRAKITDAEISSLFLGLCRIVKQQAIDNAKSLINSETERSYKLCKEIVKKNREIEMLRMINYQLKKKIDKYCAESFKPNKQKNSINE